MKLLLVAKILIGCLILVDSLNSSNVVLAIDCGSSIQYTSYFGFVYQPDNYYYNRVSGHIHEEGSSFGLTSDSYIYRISYASPDNPWGYKIPISYNGKYVLVLQFAENYFGYANDRIFTIKIGNYVVKSNLDVALEVGIYKAYDIYVEFTLSNGSVYIDGSSILGAYSNGKLNIDLHPIREWAMISGIVLEGGDCSISSNCNIYDPKCVVYISALSNTCGTCIANASPINGVCSCNSRFTYDIAAKKCICDALLQCDSCPSNNYLVSNVCLEACPYGFSSPCSEVAGAVIDTSFSNIFNETYGIFKTGSNETSYHFFSSPESLDPIPAKNRGLYFSERVYLETTSAVYFSFNFSLGLWVWISPGSGHILTHSNSRITITETGSLNILLEDKLKSTHLMTTNSLSPSNSAWIYLSYVVSFSFPSTTIKTYLNNALKESISQQYYIYRDLPGKTIILGKSSSSNFNGFIYQFQLWNSAVSNFNNQYLDQLCGAGAISSCLWSCDISSWIYNGEIYACDEACSAGCVRKKSCNICYDSLCSVCRGFSDGLCDQCVTNASGTPCSCNEGYMLSDSEDSCVKCSGDNPSCNGNELAVIGDVIYDETLVAFDWKYYKIPFYQGHKNNTLIINTDFYIPQIYIALNSNNSKPDFTSHNYSSTTQIQKSLEITIGSDFSTHISCISELKGHYDSNKQCTYHIGIFSPISTTYSIRFKSITIIPQLIHTGSSVSSSMTQNEHKYYYGIIEINSISAVKINSLKGRASLYVSLFDYGFAGKDPTQWPLPYASSNLYNTSNSYDVLKFEKNYLTSICQSKKCLIEICKICWNGPCQSELSLLNQSYIQPSIYYNATVCLGCFHYYEIPFYYGHKAVKIILSPINASDVDLYVSLNANNQKPDINTYDYKLAKSWQVSEEITLKFDEIAQNNCPTNLTANHEGDSLCIYHVGIYGFSSAHYKLIYYESDLSDTLRTGSVQVKSIGSSKHGVYYSLIDSNFDAIIKVDELMSGSMIISVYDYAAVKKDIPKLTKNLDPKTTIIVENNTDIVSLNNTSLKNWCPSKTCLAQICLHCPEIECYPMLQLIQDNEITIDEGANYRDFVDELTFKDFKIPFSYGHKVITVELNVYKGDAEMYISLNNNNGRPSTKIYDYKSNSNLPKKEITLENDSIALKNCPQFEGLASHEKNSVPCYYHIGILGKRASGFTIQVYSSLALPTEILSNSPISVTNINATENRFFNVMNTEKYAIISIERIYGETLLYASIFDFSKIGPDSAFWPLPKDAIKQYKSKSEFSEEIFIKNDMLKEACPSGLCITLLCSFCLSDSCEYELSVIQKIKEEQQGLLISSSQTLILVGFIVACLVFGVVLIFRGKKQGLRIKDREMLTEALIDKNDLAEERKASAVNKVSDF